MGGADRRREIILVYLAKRKRYKVKRIMVAGVQHFTEMAIDFSKIEINKQLQEIAVKLSSFKPDAVCVELPYHQQERIDAFYEDFSLSHLTQAEKYAAPIGEIMSYGQQRSLSFSGEAVQLGFRLAKMLMHDKVFAVNEDTSQNIFALSEYAQPAIIAQCAQIISNLAPRKDANLLSVLKNVNDIAWSEENHKLYMLGNTIQTENSRYLGADLVSDWYKRNLRIFANLQELAELNNNIIFFVGAGHLKLLKSFISACPGMEFVSALAYL